MLYQSETLQLDWLDRGIAELIFNAPGPVNKLDIKTLSCFDNVLGTLQKNQPALKGLILRSTKAAFIVGADITEFLPLFNAPQEKLHAWLVFANSIFNRLEDLPVPTISLINGYALGGGCECILATDFRIASPDARIGLPETKLGIMPGFGGSVRLPRLVGADNALEMIATGKDFDARAALKTGLVDAIIAADKLSEAGVTMLQQAINGHLNWRARRQPKLEPLKLNPIETSMCFTMAKGMALQVAGTHYPAPMQAIKTIEAAASLGRDDALKLETASFVPLAHSIEARALVGIFLNDQHVKGQAKKLSKMATVPQQIAVLGAGIMGGGIAYQSALKGIAVLMKDINTRALTQGMHEAARLLNQELERGKLDGLKMASILTMIRPTLHYTDIEQAQVIIEAVVENQAVKTAVLAETESLMARDAILASNTSTIPVSQLTKTLTRPENFCGMHFFNPVHKMQLVEIIRGEKTSEKTISTAVALATHMGKTAIVVNDCAGFFVNRVLFPYFAGFGLLLRDGADFQYVDNVMEKQFGWPMGPAWLLDVVGIDTAHHAQAVMASYFPERMSKNYRDAIDVMFDNQRFGQKNGHGFYRYTLDNKGKPCKEEDKQAAELLTDVCPPNKNFSAEEIIDRLMFPMINETVRCLEEGIIATPAQADMALIYGLGFPPFRGGVFRYLDTLGSRNYMEMTQRYTHLGNLYQIPPGLQEKAQNNQCYYPDPTPLTELMTEKST